MGPPTEKELEISFCNHVMHIHCGHSVCCGCELAMTGAVWCQNVSNVLMLLCLRACICFVCCVAFVLCLHADLPVFAHRVTCTCTAVEPHLHRTWLLLFYCYCIATLLSCQFSLFHCIVSAACRLRCFIVLFFGCAALVAHMFGNPQLLWERVCCMNSFLVRSCLWTLASDVL